MRIDVVTPPMSKDQFTGGLWCVMQYAQGLAAKGHSVRVIPMVPCSDPQWVPGPRRFEFVGKQSGGAYARWRTLVSSMVGGLRGDDAGRRRRIQVHIADLINIFLLRILRFLPYEVARGASLSYLSSKIGSADVTIATHFETALAVSLFGGGRRMYFAQHFEPLFWREHRGGEVARREALGGYHIGLEMIANSSWLKDQLLTEGRVEDVKVCLNAINHEHFFPRGDRVDGDARSVRVISYGGRNVDWKGFSEMAAAVRRAKELCPDHEIDWRVYGGAALPPVNSVASYRDLGFLSPQDLGSAYRDADILLSASWYESFPLFPLEAMACGIAVVTTRFGTEDYAIHGETAEVVEARNIDSIAAGLSRLIVDKNYRQQLSNAGVVSAKRFTWDSSIETMERIVNSDDVPGTPY